MADILTIDMETFYGDDYTLSKLTTEAYVRDPRFETILCGFKINDGRAWYVVGEDVRRQLNDLDIPRRIVLAHHAHFDGLILSHHYGLHPRMWLDTLGMARHLHGPHGGLSLAKLAQRYGIGAKGEEVVLARGLRLADFGEVQLAKYGQYCCNDCDLEYDPLHKMLPEFSPEELMVNDQIVRMFTNPMLVLDTKMLRGYADKLAADKLLVMIKAGVQREDLMSNDKFAALLMELGVDPPRKVSPTFMKKTPEAQQDALTKNKAAAWAWAFAKSDRQMQELQEHPDERVQMLVEARLKNKTTIAEKGAQRLIGMSERGHATVYLKYSGAQGTHRFSGGDLFNWQSMKRGSDLRNATMAPRGHKCAVADSSTIEARLLDWLSGQENMVEVYRKADRKEGPDVYCTLGGRIYKRLIEKDRDPMERQMGKVAKLGLGFGMGHEKFVFAVRAQAKEKVLARNPDGSYTPGVYALDEHGKPVEKPLVITPAFSKEVVTIYRESHPQVLKLWKRGEHALECIAGGEYGVNVDFRGIVKTCQDGLVLPGINGSKGIHIRYPELRRVKAPPGSVFEYEWEFWNGKDRERIYGAKVVENIIQCLARIVVIGQCLNAAKEVRSTGSRWVHSMHDEGVFVAPDFYATWVLERMMAHFRTAPAFAPDLPLNCEGGIHQRYGLAKK